MDIDDAPAPNAAMEVVPHPEVLMRLGVDLISVKLGGAKKSGTSLGNSGKWSDKPRSLAITHIRKAHASSDSETPIFPAPMERAFSSIALWACVNPIEVPAGERSSRSCRIAG